MERAKVFKNTATRALLFDFGQTLVDSAEGFRSAEKKAKDSIFSHLGTRHGGPSLEEFVSWYRIIRKKFHQKSRFSRSAIWQAVYHHFNGRADLNLLEKWENEYWDLVKAQTKPFPETFEVLEKLRLRYHLGLITNTQGQKGSGKHRIALFPDLERFFEVIIVAGESGVPPKPDPAPFNLCLARLNVTSHEAVMIGDDWRIDIGGAVTAGIQPVWLQHYSVQRNWPEVETSVPIITRLEQLLHLESLKSLS